MKTQPVKPRKLKTFGVAQGSIMHHIEAYDKRDAKRRLCNLLNNRNNCLTYRPSQFDGEVYNAVELGM